MPSVKIAIESESFSINQAHEPFCSNVKKGLITWIGNRISTHSREKPNRTLFTQHLEVKYRAFWIQRYTSLSFSRLTFLRHWFLPMSQYRTDCLTVTCTCLRVKEAKGIKE